MTTDITNTEVIEPKTQYQIASEFVKENDFETVVQHLVQLQESYTVAKNANQNIIEQRDYNRRQHNNTIETVTEFIKEHVTDGSVDIDDLKELADSLDIELTKQVEITFNVTYKATATVPLDFDTDDIDENDFSVSVEYNGNSEVEEEYCDIEDFDIADDN